MIRAELFLGIPVTDSVHKALAHADPSLVQVFVRDDGEYLRQISYKGRQYLGKFAGDLCDLVHLELLQANIQSLLNKLLPADACQQTPLEIFTMPVPD